MTASHPTDSLLSSGSLRRASWTSLAVLMCAFACILPEVQPAPAPEAIFRSSLVTPLHVKKVSDMDKGECHRLIFKTTDIVSTISQDISLTETTLLLHTVSATSTRTVHTIVERDRTEHVVETDYKTKTNVHTLAYTVAAAPVISTVYTKEIKTITLFDRDFDTVTVTDHRTVTGVVTETIIAQSEDAIPSRTVIIETVTPAIHFDTVTVSTTMITPVPRSLPPVTSTVYSLVTESAPSLFILTPYPYVESITTTLFSEVIATSGVAKTKTYTNYLPTTVGATTTTRVSSIVTHWLEPYVTTETRSVIHRTKLVNEQLITIPSTTLVVQTSFHTETATVVTGTETATITDTFYGPTSISTVIEVLPTYTSTVTHSAPCLRPSSAQRTRYDYTTPSSFIFGFKES